jgi:hypothetical protein
MHGSGCVFRTIIDAFPGCASHKHGRRPETKRNTANRITLFIDVCESTKNEF